jgi:hypothetical protein
MVSALDALEADFFGDLAQDTHGVWEVFEFVRLHYPDLADVQVFERGYDYIWRWLRSDWIRVSDSPLHPSEIRPSELLDFLRQHGSAATRYLEDAPSLDITEEGQRVFANETI